jgi:hypothetical protein
MRDRSSAPRHLTVDRFRYRACWRKLITEGFGQSGTFELSDGCQLGTLMLFASRRNEHDVPLSCGEANIALAIWLTRRARQASPCSRPSIRLPRPDAAW